MTERALIARRYDATSVLVTGGAGFIGTHISARLASFGAQVVVFGRHATGSGDIAEFVPGDVRDDTAVNRLIERRFDYMCSIWLPTPGRCPALRTTSRA